MDPLFQRLKEMIFKNTTKHREKGFFHGGNENELHQLKENGIAYKSPNPKDTDNATISKE